MPTYLKQYSDCQSVIEDALSNGTTELTVNGTGDPSGATFSPGVVIAMIAAVVALVAVIGLLLRRRRLRRRAG
jgi:hypothetical protein